MTAIGDTRKGDRVRATSKTNDDTAEFIVFKVTEAAWLYLYSETNVYSSEKFTFEVLKRAEKPLPTVPGLYTLREEDTKINSFVRLLLTTHGEWFWIDFTASAVAQKVRDMSPYVYPGTDYDLTLVYGGAK